MINPITPDEVYGKQANLIPEAVIDCWNGLIARNFNNGQAKVMQEEAVEILMTRMQVTRSEVFSNRWLEIEGLYRQAGWRILYDKPGYNEEYKAYFVFRKRMKVDE